MKRKTLYITSATLAVPVLALALAASAASPSDNAQAWRGFTKLTDEQKQTLQQARDLRKEGKNDEAKALLEQSGLPKPPLLGRFRHPFQNPPNQENRQAVHEAVMNNDYAKFEELTKDTPFGAKIDEASFAKLAQAEQLRTSGDQEGARNIMKELFPNARPEHGLHLGQRLHKPTRQANK